MAEDGILPGFSEMEHAVLMVIDWEYWSSWAKKEAVFGFSL